jgi:hypothetical protein
MFPLGPTHPKTLTWMMVPLMTQRVMRAIAWTPLVKMTLMIQMKAQGCECRIGKSEGGSESRCDRCRGKLIRRNLT